MNTTVSFDVVAFKSALLSADKATTTAFNACGKCAGMLAELHNPSAPFKDEYKRLMKFGKDTIAAEKIALKHSADVLKFVGRHLLVAMAPTDPIEFKKNTGTIVVPAEDLKTAREIAAAAKQIRENHGMADGRANARTTPKAKPKTDTKAGAAVDVLQTLAGMIRNDEKRAAIFAVIEKAGYKITLAPAPKAKVKVKAK